MTLKNLYCFYQFTTWEFPVLFMPDINYSSDGSFNEMPLFKTKKQGQAAKGKLSITFGEGGEKTPWKFSVKCFINSHGA